MPLPSGEGTFSGVNDAADVAEELVDAELDWLTTAGNDDDFNAAA